MKLLSAMALGLKLAGPVLAQEPDGHSHALASDLDLVLAHRIVNV
jgi:hypothetical protein